MLARLHSFCTIRIALIFLLPALAACSSLTVRGGTECASGGGIVCGVATNAGPVTGMVVHAVDARGNWADSALTDLNGRFRVDGRKLTPPYLVTVAANDPDGSPILLSSIVRDSLQTHVVVSPASSLIVQAASGGEMIAPVRGDVLENDRFADARLLEAERRFSKQLAPVLREFGIQETTDWFTLGLDDRLVMSVRIERLLAVVPIRVKAGIRS